ncbi:MAG TPA: 1,4-alpha-glucan branching protein domain-containing protein [Terriglobales bacterium]
MPKIPQAAAYATITLHAHLPYVVNHGTWPHGLEWLLEAAAETYLPMLRAFRELEQLGSPLRANINFSPILCEQLRHPVFRAELPRYLQRKVEAARQDQIYFQKNGDAHLVSVAQFWEQFFEQDQKDFEALGGDILKGFQYFDETGQISIITCAATHGYFPLLGFDSCISAQVKTGVATHKKHFGKAPKGIWVPECGYRPAGEWSYPVPWSGESNVPQPFYRKGVEQFLGADGIDFFFVDTHLVETSARFTPYDMLIGGVPVALEEESDEPHPSLYRPYLVDGPGRPDVNVAIFPRDPRTGTQVWSGDIGYPGDPVYLDFHKKRWPGGHRYWQVTNSKIDMALKTPYYPQHALDKTRSHAAHFASITRDVLAAQPQDGNPPILTSPFDAELFGHWWFEGAEWLKNLAIEFGRESSPVKLISCADYLEHFQPSGYLQLPEGSWGKNGNNFVWLNENTSWTWTHIYPAEEAVRQMAKSGMWRKSPEATRLAKQICRELLLLESSDWQFLITTEAARDYAEKRFNTHLDQFRVLIDAWRRYESGQPLSAETLLSLSEIETRDSVFEDIDPQLWA